MDEKRLRELSGVGQLTEGFSESDVNQLLKYAQAVKGKKVYLHVSDTALGGHSSTGINMTGKLTVEMQHGGISFKFDAGSGNEFAFYAKPENIRAKFNKPKSGMQFVTPTAIYSFNI